VFLDHHDSSVAAWLSLAKWQEHEIFTFCFAVMYSCSHYTHSLVVADCDNFFMFAYYSMSTTSDESEPLIRFRLLLNLLESKPTQTNVWCTLFCFTIGYNSRWNYYICMSFPGVCVCLIKILKLCFWIHHFSDKSSVTALIWPAVASRTRFMALGCKSLCTTEVHWDLDIKEWSNIILPTCFTQSFS